MVIDIANAHQNGEANGDVKPSLKVNGKIKSKNQLRRLKAKQKKVNTMVCSASLLYAQLELMPPPSIPSHSLLWSWCS